MVSIKTVYRTMVDFEQSKLNEWMNLKIRMRKWKHSLIPTTLLSNAEWKAEYCDWMSTAYQTEQSIEAWDGNRKANEKRGTCNEKRPNCIIIPSIDYNHRQF